MYKINENTNDGKIIMYIVFKTNSGEVKLFNISNSNDINNIINKYEGIFYNYKSKKDAIIKYNELMKGGKSLTNEISSNKKIEYGINLSDLDQVKSKLEPQIKDGDKITITNEDEDLGGDSKKEKSDMNDYLYSDEDFDAESRGVEYGIQYENFNGIMNKLKVIKSPIIKINEKKNPRFKKNDLIKLSEEINPRIKKNDLISFLKNK